MSERSPRDPLGFGWELPGMNDDDEHDPVYKNDIAAKRFKRGDRKMSDAVLRYIYPTIEREAFALPSSEREDALLGIMKKVLEKRDRYDHRRAPIRAWVHVIARNHVTDIRRQLERDGRQVRLTEDDDDRRPMLLPSRDGSLDEQTERRRLLLRSMLGYCLGCVDEPLELELLHRMFLDGREKLTGFCSARGLSYGQGRTLKKRAYARLLECLRNFESHDEYMAQLAADLGGIDRGELRDLMDMAREGLC